MWPEPSLPWPKRPWGKQIVLVNKPGGSGAISTQYVLSRPADGYTLLYGAENPQLHRILGLADTDYKDFYPINVLGLGVGVIVCNVDQPWQTLPELIEDAKKNPGKITMGGTGPGGLPHTVGAMLKKVCGVEFNSIPFKGEGPGVTAMLGGHVQFMPTGITATREHIRAGRVRALALVADSPVPGLEDIPLIIEYYPEFKKLLPWGPFYGVWVKKGTPADREKVLMDAFQKAGTSKKFEKFILDFGAVPLNLSGDEANKFLQKWQSVTCWLFEELGQAKVSPAKLGIPKPE